MAANGQVYAWNYLASQDSGGLTVQIARVLIGEKSAVGIDFSNGGTYTLFDDKPVVAEIDFIISNKTDKTINIYTDQDMVVAG